MLLGSIVGELITGTFECSDFNNGGWTSNLLKTVQVIDILVAGISFVGDSCSFDSNFSGCESDIVDQASPGFCAG